MILNALRIRPTARSALAGDSGCQAVQPARAHAGAAAGRVGPAFWTERMVRGGAGPLLVCCGGGEPPSTPGAGWRDRSTRRGHSVL